MRRERCLLSLVLCHTILLSKTSLMLDVWYVESSCGYDNNNNNKEVCFSLVWERAAQWWGRSTWLHRRLESSFLIMLWKRMTRRTMLNIMRRKNQLMSWWSWRTDHMLLLPLRKRLQILLLPEISHHDYLPRMQLRAFTLFLYWKVSFEKLNVFEMNVDMFRMSGNELEQRWVIIHTLCFINSQTRQQLWLFADIRKFKWFKNSVLAQLWHIPVCDDLGQWCQTDPVKGHVAAGFPTKQEHTWSKSGVFHSNQARTCLIQIRCVSFQPSKNTPDPNQACSWSVWHHWSRFSVSHSQNNWLLYLSLLFTVGKSSCKWGLMALKFQME